MSNLTDYATSELERIYGPLSDLPKDGINYWACNDILELISTFAKQEHSGSSAPYVVRVFSKLAMFEPLSPVEDEDWVEVGEGVYQSRRINALFYTDKDGKAYYLDAIIWRDPEGCAYTGTVEGPDSQSYTSRQYIRFPFTPRSFYVDVSEEGIILDLEGLKEALEYYDGQPQEGEGNDVQG